MLPTGKQFTIELGEQRAVAVEIGGGLRSYEVAGRELLDTYGPGEMAVNSRGLPLVPWPNRVEGGRYDWDGQALQLPLSEPARGNAIHGLTRWLPWVCRRHASDAVELGAVVAPQPGYPFALDVAVEYRLSELGLEVRTTARNLGDQPLPYASGHHPYLAPPPGTPLDECLLAVPAARWLQTDAGGIPTRARDVFDTPLDFRTPRALGQLQLDTAFTDLTRGADQRWVVTLVAPDGVGSCVWGDASYHYVQLFTGDTLPSDRRRRGLAVEPMTGPANAFRSGDHLVRLEPGAQRSCVWGIGSI